CRRQGRRRRGLRLCRLLDLRSPPGDRRRRPQHDGGRVQADVAGLHQHAGAQLDARASARRIGRAGRGRHQRADVGIQGRRPAGAELLAMDRLREASGSPLDPSGSKGAVTAQVTLGLAIDPDMPKGSVNYNVVADIANFSVDHFMMAQRIEAQTLRVTANPQGYQARGDVRIGGMPAMVDYRKPRGDGEAELRLQATFDDAARTRFGFDFSGAVTG